MARKITNALLILIIIVAAGAGFYLGNQKFAFIQSIFDKSSKSLIATTSSTLGGASIENEELEEEISLESPIVINEEPSDKLDTPSLNIEESAETEIETTQTETNQMSLAEIEQQLNEIQKQVDILKLEVPKYVAEYELQQIKDAEIQKQIEEIKAQIDTLIKEKQSISQTTTTIIGEMPTVQKITDYNAYNLVWRC
jgi:chromosome segregation ATPase